MPQVLTSSYLTSLISPWLWATKKSGCTCSKAPRVRVSTAPDRLPLTADRALRAGVLQYCAISKKLFPLLTSSDAFLQMAVAVV